MPRTRCSSASASIGSGLGGGSFGSGLGGRRLRGGLLDSGRDLGLGLFSLGRLGLGFRLRLTLVALGTRVAVDAGGDERDPTLLDLGLSNPQRALGTRQALELLPVAGHLEQRGDSL